jgi:hypothetical protein
MSSLNVDPDHPWTPEETTALAKELLYYCMKNTSQTSGNLFSGGLGVSYLQYLFVVCQQPSLLSSTSQQKTNYNATTCTKNSNNNNNNNSTAASISTTTSAAKNKIGSGGSIYRSKRFLQQALEGAQAEAARQRQKTTLKYQSLALGEWVGAQTLMAICHIRLGHSKQAKEAGVQLLKRLHAKATATTTTATTTTTTTSKDTAATSGFKDCTVLHGRAGALQAIWWLRQEFQKPALSAKLVIQLACQILKEANRHVISKHGNDQDKDSVHEEDNENENDDNDDDKESNNDSDEHKGSPTAEKDGNNADKDQMIMRTILLWS